MRQLPMGLQLTLVLLAAALAAVGWLAYDARAQAAELRTDLATAQADLEASFEASTDELGESVGSALEQMAPELRRAASAADRVDDLERALYGMSGTPAFTSLTLTDIESRLYDAQDSIDALESCMQSISGYLDGRSFQFFCRYL